MKWMILHIPMLFLFLGCTPSELNIEQLHAYVLDHSNGLVQLETKGDIEIETKYKPVDFIVAQEVAQHQTDALIDSLRHNFSKYSYFEVTYSGIIDNNSLSQNIEQLAFNMGSRVSLRGSTGKTYPLADYHFPRLFGVGNQVQFLFAFDNSGIEKEDQVTLQISDWGLGSVLATFQMQDINQIPTVSFPDKA